MMLATPASAKTCATLSQWMAAHFEAHETTSSQKIRAKAVRSIVKLMRRMYTKGCIIIIREPKQ